MKKGIILTAVITFVVTSLLWLIIAMVVAFHENNIEPTIISPDTCAMPNITDTYTEMESSSNVTFYDTTGKWVGSGLLVETRGKAYLLVNRDRYELSRSDKDEYRYMEPEEHLYVK